MSDKLDMAKTKKFNKSELKAEMQEKNPLIEQEKQEMIEQEKQAGES